MRHEDLFSRTRQIRTLGGSAGELHTRVGALEANADVAIWITAGTPGVDGVDALIAANPSPYNVTPWVPFVTGGCDPLKPVQFARDPVTGQTLTIGKPIGLSAGDILLYYPAPFRPAEDEPLISRGTGSLIVAFWTARASDGALIFDGAGTVT